MHEQKSKIEFKSVIFCAICSVLGSGLCLTGLLLPYWYEYDIVDGNVLIKLDVGLWVDRICPGDGDCDTKWIVDYDRMDGVTMPSGHLIKWFETIGTGLGFLSILTLIIMYRTRFSSTTTKHLAQVLFFVPCLLAGFLTVTGTLVLSSKEEKSRSSWAPFLSGAGGALFFLAACTSCVVCRFDPSYGTLENPVSPKYVVRS